MVVGFVVEVYEKARRKGLFPISAYI